MMLFKEQGGDSYMRSVIIISICNRMIKSRRRRWLEHVGDENQKEGLDIKQRIILKLVLKEKK
jgi:hypothetical protein